MNQYHYTECGLDNIYLVNGFEITKTDNGDEEVFIHNIHGLHQAIGKALVFKQGLLAGNDIKFIRTTLDLSQTSLGRLLGLDYQTILGWEKNKSPISKTADHLLRIIFFSYLNRETDCTLYDKINEIADIDAGEVEASKIELKEVEDGWRLAA